LRQRHRRQRAAWLQLGGKASLLEAVSAAGDRLFKPPGEELICKPGNQSGAGCAAPGLRPPPWPPSLLPLTADPKRCRPSGSLAAPWEMRQVQSARPAARAA